MPGPRLPPHLRSRKRQNNCSDGQNFDFRLSCSSLARPQTTVVVELFTSEGCSSCPPADQVLSRLESPRYGNAGKSKQVVMVTPGVEVIALGEHVDYWDQLGWKDRFSSPLFSARQQDYGRAFHLESVYTPEMIVNGQKEVLGSDPRAVQEAINKAAKEPQAQVAIAMASAQIGFLQRVQTAAWKSRGRNPAGCDRKQTRHSRVGRGKRRAGIAPCGRGPHAHQPGPPGSQASWRILGGGAAQPSPGLESRQSETRAVCPGPCHATNTGRGIGH